MFIVTSSNLALFVEIMIPSIDDVKRVITNNKFSHTETFRYIYKKKSIIVSKIICCWVIDAAFRDTAKP